MKIREVLQLLSDPATKGSDTCISGDLDGPVTSVFTTFTATYAVLQEAARTGANLIITHEPTFYQDDRQEELAADPVYQAKRHFIESHGLTIWRCHDFWHRFPGDGILIGMAKQLGWHGKAISEHREIFELPERSLETLVHELKTILKIPSLRVIGDPQSLVRRVALSCGSPYWSDHRRLLNVPGVDTLVCGELREWETCEYVRDAVASGSKTSLIVLGHCNSEEAGMKYLAHWLQERVPQVPIRFVPAGDPYRYA